MTSDFLPGLLVMLSLAALLVAAGWRARRWLAGRPAAVDIFSGLLQAPRRYLVHVHEAVSRDPIESTPRDTGRRTAGMHVLTAGGLVSATVLIIAVHVLGFDGAMPTALLLLCLATMAAGALMLALRRWPGDIPERLSRGGFQRLPFSVAAFVVFFIIATLPLTAIMPPIVWTSPGGLMLLALGAWACLELYVGMGLGPMKHALNGVLHLAFHPRPSRFNAGRLAPTDSGLQGMDLAEARLGVERPVDFRWNQLLGFDACVQCGRCESACPAYAAGLPLNPKKLIQDLVAAECERGSDVHYTGHPHPDGDAAGVAHGGPILPVVGAQAMLRPETIWACTTCRACVYECPMMIEHVDAVIDLRRYQTLELGATPGKGAEVLEELRATDTVSGRALNTRLDWAADLKLPVLAERGACDVLLWVGEGGFEMRAQRTLRAVVKLLRAANVVDIAVLGEEELDCGDLARRLGDEATFQDLARRNIATLAKYRFDSIVTCDPHVLHALRNEYAALGGHYTVEHHTMFLARQIEEGRLTPKPMRHNLITFHDPCYLGRYNGEIEAPRKVLKSIGIKVIEMQRSGLRSSCCGWGGGAAYTDVPGKRRIADVRMDHVRATNAGTVAVACPNCAVMLEGVTQPRAEVTDVAELLWAAVEAPS
ncbi:MAG: DUF3483 domain-containing protein [Gammaproteobacteria bacterium]|nr:DUF3483 domain-containing protein [Gammaproteobacteria bacterium]